MLQKEWDVLDLSTTKVLIRKAFSTSSALSITQRLRDTGALAIPVGPGNVAPGTPGGSSIGSRSGGGGNGGGDPGLSELGPGSGLGRPSLLGRSSGLGIPSALGGRGPAPRVGGSCGGGIPLGGSSSFSLVSSPPEPPGVGCPSLGPNSSSSSSASSINPHANQIIFTFNKSDRGRTFSINLWVLSKTVLHTPKLLHAVDPLRLFLGVYKTRKRFAEFWSAWTVRHPAQAGAVPVYLTRFWVEGAAFCVRGLRFRFGGRLGL